MNQNVNVPQAESWAPKHLGNYSLTDLSQTDATIVTQFWAEAYYWARKLALRVMDGKFVGNYWAEEFSDLAIATLWIAWTKHADLKGEQWFKFAKTVMVRTILRYVITEKRRDKYTDSLSIDFSDDSFHRSADALESRRLNAEPYHTAHHAFDDQQDLNVEFAGFFKELTSSERRVLPERVNNPSATSEEVAEWAGFPSGGSVRYHEMNYRLKAKKFIEKRPNKKEWQRYLLNEVSNSKSLFGATE